jgi:hypothetical protein
MSDEMQLWVTVEEVEPVEIISGARDSDDIGGGFGAKSAIEKIKEIARKRVPLDAVLLKSQMNGMLKVVGDLFDQAQVHQGMQLSEVELTVEINADCSVSLVGTGGKVGNTGGIKLKFSRKPA